MMSRKIQYLMFLVLFALNLQSCKSTKTLSSISEKDVGKPATEKGEPTEAPYVMREFRAAWIASVANINWPSTSGLTSQEQQEEAILLLDFLKSHHYNAVIFQVRPQADALYRSSLEIWSNLFY